MSNLKEIIETSFRQYAGAVLQSRALVDVRDCLKPSARQIFYCMYTDNLVAEKPIRKTQASVGSFARMYIHGEQSGIGVIMRAGQPFATRYPLVEIRGGYGNLIESGNYAAPRYTEARLSKISSILFKNIEKNTVEEWRDNFDDTEKYPMVLPSRGYYNIVNGTFGIGIGAASSIPPFNLGEVNSALIKLLWDPDIDFEEIYCAPDFPTGGVLLNEEEVKESLRTGQGKACRIRSVVEYDTRERALIVKEIPYSVYTNTICGELEEILEGDRNPGIDRFNDLTGENPLIKIYLNRGVNPDRVLEFLYKNTSLQSYYGVNLTMLENGRYPKVFTWKQALQAFLDHQIEVYVRTFNYELEKIKNRIHIIEGILIALARIEEVVEVIKSSSTTAAARQNLTKNFLLSEPQAKAILEIRLARLASLEVKKFEKEKEELLKEKERIEKILNSEELLKKEVEKDLKDVVSKFGDARRTIVRNLEEKDDKIVEKKSILLNLTNQNNLLVSESSTLYTQRRGGKGNKFKLNSDEYIIETLTGSTNETGLFFSTDGVVYQYRFNNLNFEEKVSLDLILNLPASTQICNMTSLNPKNLKPHIIFITKKGYLKKSLLSEYNIRRETGIKAIELEPDDKIRSILFVDKEQIGILSKDGNLIRIETDEIRPIGRVARGVKGINLRNSDEVAAAQIIEPNVKELIGISEKGFAKRTSLREISVTGRATIGAKFQSLKEGDQMAFFLPLKEEKEIVVVSNKGKLKTKINEIRILSRGAMGTLVKKLSGDERIIGLSKI